MRKSIRRSPPDYFFTALVASLVVFGLVMLASASSDLGQVKFGDSYFYLKHQMMYGLSLGIIGFIITANIYYRRWLKISLYLFIASVILLVLVFTPLGFKSGGAARWLQIGPVAIQPGEIVKMMFIVYLAAWLSSRRSKEQSFSENFLPFLFFIGVISVLLFAQPSTGTVLITVLTSLIVYFLSGARLRFILATVAAGALGIIILVNVTPYRLERLKTFLDPMADELGSGYHINQARIAIGSGGLSGIGYGQSTSKVKYLPEPIGDSIFAVISEELGFIGATGLIAAFFLLTLKSFLIAYRMPDQFGRLVALGFGALVGVQAFINIGAISGLTPLTGVPLPFVSYGGTALFVFLTMAGMVVNVSKYRRSDIRG